MSSLTPSGGNVLPEQPSSEVTTIRKLLQEVGQQYHNLVQDEVHYVEAKSNGAYSIHLNRKGISSVQGIFRATDVDKENNLFTGLGDHTDPDGIFDRNTGEVVLSTNFNYTYLEKVLVDYVHQEGLTDDDIETIFVWSQKFLNLTTGDWTIDFSNGTKGWWGAVHVARLSCMLMLSTGSVMQSGYNLRIEDFALETKAWGEGMIAQFLWQQYQKEMSEILIGFGCNIRAVVTQKPDHFGTHNTGDMRL